MQQMLLLEDSTVAYRIEPFYFEQGFSTIENLNGFRPLAFTKEMFYDYIDKLMFLKKKETSYENQIAHSYQINWNKRTDITYLNSYQQQEMALPAKGTEYEYLVEAIKDQETNEIIQEKYIRFKIDNIQLIISEMQVGFLVYDLQVVELFDMVDGTKQPLPQTLDNYEWAMYYLRKLQIAKEGYLNAYMEDPEATNKKKEYYIRRKEAEKNGFPFTEKEPDEPQMTPIPLKWTDMTAGLLKELGKTHSFTNKKKVGHHTLLYTSAFLETPPGMAETGEVPEGFDQFIANKVFKISHGYRETYHKDVKVEDIVQPFNNIMWSLSAEGAANIVYYPPGEQARKFFDNSFRSKRTTNYYYMYLLALFQKYSLLYFMIRTTKLLFQSSVYNGEILSKEERDEELIRTRSFHAEMLKFTIHGYYEQVSYHTHYNDIYEQLIKALRIPELQQELSPKTEAFRKVIETLVSEQNALEKELANREERKRHEQEQQDKKRAEEERRKQLDEEKRTQERQNNVIQTITYFLLPATLTTGILGMNIPLISNSTDFFLAYAIFGVTLVTALLSTLLNKEIKWIPAKKIMIYSILLLALFASLDLAVAKPDKSDAEPQKQLEAEEQIDTSTDQGGSQDDGA